MSTLTDWSPTWILLGLFTAYAVAVSLFLILENRSPQSTFAWIFFFLLFPVGGLLIYFFIGRGWRAFSREDAIKRQVFGEESQADRLGFLSKRSTMLDRMVREAPETFKPKLLRLVRKNANSELTIHNRLELLQDAQQKYPRLLADIEAAQHSIHLLYYIWEEDEFTEGLKYRLIRKAQSGVDVRILVDAHGAGVSRQYMRELGDNGVQMFIYYNFLSLYNLHTLTYRNHRKIAIIDGKIGYTGGLNMSQEHLTGGKHFRSWRDTHLRIEGEATRVLQSIFATSWYNTTAESLSSPVYYPPPTDCQRDYLPIQITVSGPDSQWAAIRQLYFQMITTAEHHIYIQSPFFIPDDSILEALKAAALSGVDVRIMCAPRGGVYQIPYRAAHTYFAELAEAGARIYLYEKGYFHPKTVNVDSVVCSVGTANMDIRSFSINYEVNAVIYDRRVARQLANDFRKDMRDCIEFSLAEYDARSLFARLYDSAARLASPLL